MRPISYLASAALTIALAACSHPAPTTTTSPTETRTAQTEPTSQQPTCTDAAANVEVEIRAGGGDALSDDQYARIHAFVLDSCTGEPWPAEAVECAATSHGEAMSRCDATLSQEINRKLDEQLDAILAENRDAEDAEDAEDN